MLDIQTIFVGDLKNTTVERLQLPSIEGRLS